MLYYVFFSVHKSYTQKKQFVERTKCCSMWDLNPQLSAQLKPAKRPLKLITPSVQ